MSSQSKEYDDEMKAIKDGKVMRRYFTGIFSLEKVKPSTYTYPDALHGIKALSSSLLKSGQSLDDIFIIGPYYRLIPTKEDISGDTQPIAGGKRGLNETHLEAAQFELNEELRITCSLEPIKVPFGHIYQASVKKCSPIAEYTKFMSEHKRGKDQFGAKNKVAFIIWGHYQECKMLLDSIPKTKSDEFYEDITALDIMTLSKAIELTKYATEYKKKYKPTKKSYSTFVNKSKIT